MIYMMNVLSAKRFLTVLFAVMVILLPLSAAAQTDGGRRKRPKPKTEQTQPAKNPIRKPAEKKTTLSTPDGYANGHAYVDLGLPSGVKWATCNIGASSPGEYGDYFAWGETTTKSNDSTSYLTYGKSDSELQSAGIIGSSGNLTINYDAALANWGDGWRMPTGPELGELTSQCTWNWTTYGSHKGYKVTGPNGNSIFLPAAGLRDVTKLDRVGEHGRYWSSTPDNASSFTYCIGFGSDYRAGDWGVRYYGYSIRPVFAVDRPDETVVETDTLNKELAVITPDYNGHDYVDLGLPSGIKWATCNVGASSPEEAGDYFAWGETNTKSSYDESNSLTAYKRFSELRSAGIIDESNLLTLQHDAAHANWGRSWRMPTYVECKELKDYCTWNWTTQNGSKGYKVTGPNGNSIFLPAAGGRHDNLRFGNEQMKGAYWSSSPHGSSNLAMGFCFYKDGPDVDGNSRLNGYLIRPVCSVFDRPSF